MLRGTILEENIFSKNSSAAIGTKHGLAHKELSCIFSTKRRWNS